MGFESSKRIKLDQLLHQQIAIRYLIVGGDKKRHSKKNKTKVFLTQRLKGKFEILSIF